MIKKRDLVIFLFLLFLPSSFVYACPCENLRDGSCPCMKDGKIDYTKVDWSMVDYSQVNPDDLKKSFPNFPKGMPSDFSWQQAILLNEKFFGDMDPSARDYVIKNLKSPEFSPDWLQEKDLIENMKAIVDSNRETEIVGMMSSASVRKEIFKIYKQTPGEIDASKNGVLGQILKQDYNVDLYDIKTSENVLQYKFEVLSNGNLKIRAFDASGGTLEIPTQKITNAKIERKGDHSLLIIGEEEETSGGDEPQEDEGETQIELGGSGKLDRDGDRWMMDYGNYAGYTTPSLSFIATDFDFSTFSPSGYWFSSAGSLSDGHVLLINANDVRRTGDEITAKSAGSGSHTLEIDISGHGLEFSSDFLNITDITFNNSSYELKDAANVML